MAIHSEAILIIGVLIWLLLRTIIIYLNKRKGFGISLKREALLFIFYVYLLCVLSITQFPIYIIKDHHIRLSVNLIPVVGTIKDIAQTTANSPYMIRIWIRNIVGNAILLLPMGILLPLLWAKFRKVGRVTLFAFLFSLGIETLQLLLTLMGNIGRAFDVDDILLNTLGAFIGVSLYSICNRIAGSEPEPGEKYSCHGDRPRGR
jgi:glycopeptide antibiotics resistance protein